MSNTVQIEGAAKRVTNCFFPKHFLTDPQPLHFHHWNLPEWKGAVHLQKCAPPVGHIPTVYTLIHEAYILVHWKHKFRLTPCWICQDGDSLFQLNKMLNSRAILVEGLLTTWNLIYTFSQNEMDQVRSWRLFLYC